MNAKAEAVEQFATIEGRVLAAALKPLCFVVERRTTYPILSMVKLVLSGSALTVSATDLDIEISTTLDVNDSAGGWQLCVSAELLRGIAAVAGPALVRLNKFEVLVPGKKATDAPVPTTQLHITVDDGAAHYQIETVLDVDGWPKFAGERGEKIEGFGNGQFPAALARVESAISREETRYYLNGICWSITDTDCWFAATDGHRLLKFTYAKAEGRPKAARIIPRKTVELLTRFFAGADATVWQAGDNNRLDIDIGRFRVRSRLVEGEFPDIERVIPKEQTAAVTVSRRNLEAGMSRLRALPAENRFGGGQKVVFRHDDETGGLVLEARHPQIGVARTTVAADWPDDIPSFAFNSGYFAQMLKVCDGAVQIGVKDAAGPVRMIDADDTMTRIIMPMKV
ncbi:DNA polymerase III subunit beta [Devosia sp. LjRoot16]|uniref:DNA polymerase III subunit beta n=1 Tax=Devosia sp. LjRoot16 TaxID=3342271 RepID=UPI003ECE95C7